MEELSILLQFHLQVAGARQRTMAESDKAWFLYILAGGWVNIILVDEVTANPVPFIGTCANNDDIQENDV